MVDRVTSPLDVHIRRAIADRRLIELTYKNRRRVAEPHDYGRRNGTDRLLVYQLRSIEGASRPDARGWRLLDVPKIESLAILDTRFDGSRGQAHQQHHPWDELYARVK